MKIKPRISRVQMKEKTGNYRVQMKKKKTPGNSRVKKEDTCNPDCLIRIYNMDTFDLMLNGSNGL